MTRSPFRSLAKQHVQAIAVQNGLSPAAPGSSAAFRRFFDRMRAGRQSPDFDDLSAHGILDQSDGFDDRSGGANRLDLDFLVTFWRSAGWSYNAFLHESLMDEIAAGDGVDALKLRRKLMEPYPVATRLIDVIELMSDWNTPLPAGRARGFAFTLSSNTWVAQVVEVAREEAGIRVEKVFCAADAGIVPDERNFRTRMMAGILYGLSAATGRQLVDVDDGDDAESLQDGDMSLASHRPRIEVELLSNSKHRGRADEPPALTVMPALANAIFALTGERIRRMPFGDTVRFV